MLRTCPRCNGSYAEGTAVCPIDGAALAPTGEDPLLGKMLDGRLRVLRRIGEGGMGVVYAAEHVGLGKEVAVKVLGEKHSAQGEVAARLRAEARLASAIRDEHIVEVFDVGETESHRAFIVMELLHGESLAQRLARQGALGEHATLGLGRQIAQALQAAHARGIVHRDIKPENIFLCARPDGDFVKVLDFGISKALGGPEGFAPRLTQTGMIMGTPLYLSPEQARGEEQLDHRIDIYSLGVVLYECLTGQVPFSANNYLGVVSKIVASNPVPPRQRRPDLPITAVCERLVLRAMAYDRDLRYPSAAALLADLDRVVAGAAEPEDTTATDEDRSGLGWLLAGVGVLLAAGAAVALWRTPGDAPPRPPVVAAPPAVIARPSPPAPQVPPALAPAPQAEPLPVAAASAGSRPAPSPRAPVRSRPPRVRPPSPPDLPDVLHEEQAPNPFRRDR